MAYSMPAKKRTLGGGSAPAGGGAPSPSGGTPAPAAQSSPGYVNFSRLLAVNQGGAQKMADNLAGQVQQKGQASAGALESARTDMQQKIQAGTPTYEKAAPQALGGGADPNAFREAGRLSGIRASQGYAGPKDWNAGGQNTAALSAQAMEASQAAKSLTTAGGRGAMLRQQAGGPYSAGMSALDAGLSGAPLGQRGADLSALYGGLSQRLIDYQQGTDAQVGAATTAGQQVAGQYGKDQQEFIDRANQLEQQQQVPEYLAAPAAPAEPSNNPLARNDRDIEEENRRKAQRGFRG